MNTKTRTNLAVLLIAAFVATLLMLSVFAGAAFASVVEAPPNSAPTVVQVVESGGWTLEAVLLGVVVLLSAVRTVLAFLAPRTKSTIDDSILARIDAVLGMLPRQPVPVPQAVPSVVVDRQRDPQAGRALTVVMVALAGIALGLGMLVACATVRPKATAGAGAFLGCQADNVRAMLPELQPLAESAILRWLSGDGRSYDVEGIKRTAAPIKSDAGKCAFEAAIAILSTPPEQPAGPTLLAVADPGAVLRERWPSVRAELGWR